MFRNVKRRGICKMLSKSEIVQNDYKLEIICKNANGGCFMRNMRKISTLNYFECHKRSMNGKILEQRISLATSDKNDSDVLGGLYGIASTICNACHKKMIKVQSR